MFLDQSQCKTENPVHLSGTSMESMISIWWKRLHHSYAQHSIAFPKHRFVWMLQDTVARSPTGTWKDVLSKFVPTPSALVQYDHDFLAAQLEMLPMMKITVPYWNCSKAIMRMSAKFLNHLAKAVPKQKESSDGSIYFATYCATMGFKMGSLSHLTPQLIGSPWNETKQIAYSEFVEAENKKDTKAGLTQVFQGVLY
jgi:hypothetical protein